MATADWNRLLANCRTRLPGAIDETIKHQLFNTVKEFLEDTNVWKETIDFETVADQQEYDIVPTELGILHRLMWVEDANDNPRGSSMAEIGVLKLDLIPTSEETLYATISLTVIDPVDNNSLPTIPEWLLRRYMLVFEDGVLGRMMSVANTPYFNQTMAVYHMRRFRGKIATARNESTRKHMYGAQAWKFPQTWA